MTRRDLLGLGPSVAAAIAVGCRSRPGPFVDREVDTGRIAGSIVGASHEVGHRLRADGLPEPQEVRDVPVVIVGAGIAGLSAGWKLAKSGFRDFEILELESDAGGNSRWGTNDVSAYPWGAHYLPVPTVESTAVRELLEEMDMVQDLSPDGNPIYDPRHLCHAPQERLFIDGRWQEGISARGLLGTASAPERAVLTEFEQQMRRYQNYRDADGRHAFALPMALSSNDPDLVALDRISMQEYFDRAGWTSERLRWFVDYCCRDDYGCSMTLTSSLSIGSQCRSTSTAPDGRPNVCGGSSTTAVATITGAHWRPPRPGPPGTISVLAAKEWNTSLGPKETGASSAIWWGVSRGICTLTCWSIASA